MHKGDVNSLFCINQDQFLLSFSADGTMHLFKLGSLETSTKIDGDLSLVLFSFSPYTQTSLDELLQGFTESEQESTTVQDDLLCSLPLFPVPFSLFLLIRPTGWQQQPSTPRSPSLQ